MNTGPSCHVPELPPPCRSRGSGGVCSLLQDFSFSHVNVWKKAVCLSAWKQRCSGGQGPLPRSPAPPLSPTDLHLVQCDRVQPFSSACLVFTPQGFSIYSNLGVMICVVVDKTSASLDILGFFGIYL